MGNRLLTKGVGEVVLFLIFYFYSFLLGGNYKGGGQIWKAWEMSGMGVPDMKCPKVQDKNYIRKKETVAHRR